MSLVEHASRSGIIWSGATTVRARPWPSVPERAFLLISGSHGPDLRLPDATVISQWLHTLVSWGYTSVRTTAMAPRVANVFDSLGFASVQDLSLLQLHHTRADLIDLPADITPRIMPTGRIARRFRSSSLSNILSLDAAAFGTDWQMDMANFTDALSATSQSRVLVSHHNNKLVGFVLAGCTGRHGFIQRLAVHPDSRRSGVASCLLAASLNWIINNGCTDTVVNTEVSNLSAQNLYRKFGFVDMNHGLIVMEREL